MMVGIDLLEAQLKELGYNTQRLHAMHVAFELPIESGKFAGTKVKIALEAPQFPNIPPSGPHVSPHILPVTGGGGTHPFGAIHSARNGLGTDWQYWSRPCQGWQQTEMDAKSYLAFLRTLFDTIP